MIDQPDLNRLNADVRAVVALLGSSLDEHQQAHVSHYLDHGELEMAFELFCLFLMDGTMRAEPTVGTELQRIGRLLSLDAESVYDPDFWARLEEWVGSGEGTDG